jgi:hypothetical protein
MNNYTFCGYLGTYFCEKLAWISHARKNAIWPNRVNYAGIRLFYLRKNFARIAAENCYARMFIVWIHRGFLRPHIGHALRLSRAPSIAPHPTHALSLR